MVVVIYWRAAYPVVVEACISEFPSTGGIGKLQKIQEPEGALLKILG